VCTSRGRCSGNGRRMGFIFASVTIGVVRACSDDQLQMFDLAIAAEQLLLLRTQFTLLRYDQSVPIRPSTRLTAAACCRQATLLDGWRRWRP